MALVGSFHRWVSITGGAARTRIYAAPLVHAAPVQWLQFARTAPGLPSAPLTFTVWLYSAAAPWYFNTTGTATAWRNFATPTAPGDVEVSIPVDIAKAPWDAGIAIWALGSPWAECFVTASISCKANLFVP